MGEKLIHEIRIVETEDGFRIEIKGDKERLRQMGFGRGFGMPFGPGPMMFRHLRRHAPHGFPFGRHHGPWWWDAEETPSSDEPVTKA